MSEYPYIKLNNGVMMPQLGLGVWNAKDGSQVESMVEAALNAGYRLIDTAAAYGNEHGVGRAINRSSVPREDIFVTTKLWNADQGYDETLAAFDRSLTALGLDYIDLYLIHWPVPAQHKYLESWRAMEKLYADKKIRAIGVSNFEPDHLDEILQNSTIVPAVNQIELHPRFPQQELREYCQNHGIAVESWSPLGGSGAWGGGVSNSTPIMDEEVIVALAEKHHKTPAQIIIKWHLQNGLIVIPKSKNVERIAQNFDVFGFTLSDNDMAQTATLDTHERVGADPNTANFT